LSGALDLRIVGGNEEYIEVTHEADLFVLAQDAEAHQVMVSLPGLALRLWLPLDDLDWPELREDITEEDG
jgi:hypothetical protein